MVTIKRYKNRKLYDTETGAYTSIGEIVGTYLLKGVSFKVVDAYKPNVDLTVHILSYAVQDVLTRKGLLKDAETFLKAHGDAFPDQLASLRNQYTIA